MSTVTRTQRRLYIGVLLGWFDQQVILVDPGCYRQLDLIIQADTKGLGKIELLNLMEMNEGDSHLL